MSQSMAFFRFDFGGITASAPSSAMESLKASPMRPPELAGIADHNRARPVALQCSFGFQERSMSELVTTLTLENAMAAPARDGFKKPNAASGRPIRL